MTALSEPPAEAALDINHLRQGETYEAVTRSGRVATGEYLGIEVAYDQWRILIRGTSRTESIAIGELESVLAFRNRDRDRPSGRRRRTHRHRPLT